MTLIEPKVELLWITSNPLKMIELAGRTAYKSEDKITDTSAEQFVKSILKRNHGAVIEHASASLKFTCDRGVSHEIVRHRIFSFLQESTRYCNYSQSKFGNSTKVIQPPLGKENSQTIWQEAMESSEKAYFELLGNGETPQMARSTLPNSLKTEIVVTGNFREWRHFFSLRTAKDAHPQMIEVAKMALDILHKEVPVIFDDLWSEAFDPKYIKPSPYRDALIKVAKLWKGHDGVNWETTTTENIWLLIKDAVEGP